MVLYNDKWASERKDTLSQTEIRSLSCIVRSQKEILIVSATGSGRFPGGEILGCLICAGIGSVLGCFNLFVCLLLYVLFKGLVCLGFASFWGWVVYLSLYVLFLLKDFARFFYLFFFLSLPYPHSLCFSLPLPPSPSSSSSSSLIFLPFFRASLIHRSLSLPFIHRRLNTTFRQKRS